MHKDTDQKPTLLFIHGFRGNHFGLSAITKFFKTRGYSVYCPDIPPAFNTKKEHLPKLDTFSADSYATWVANYILDKKLDRPILLGHSLGSIIVATTAEKYPNLIHQKIFFLSPISKKAPSFIKYLIPLIKIIPNKLVSLVVTLFLIAKAGKPQLRNILKLTFQCAEKFTSKNDQIKAAFFSIKHSISDFNFNKQAFFIIGKQDKMNSVSQTTQVAKKYQGKVFLLEDTGHLLNYEDPLEVCKITHKKL